MNATEQRTAHSGIDRRTALSVAAWSVPVIALAVATPAQAASITDVGAFTLRGTCGTLGLLGPGFTLSAAQEPLPIGTRVVITGSGVSDIGVFTVSGGQAQVTTLSPTARQIELTAELFAGSTVAFRTTLSTSDAFTLNAVASLPDGYVGTGSKTAGNVDTTEILCAAN